ncbi:MAG TPA: hypothetical protein VEP50_15390 [bacterium]|nr:hypothetical protein [bacterium]
MDRAQTVQSRMREDELVAQIRYHEDRLRAIEREAAFHQAAVEQARTDLDALRQPVTPRPHLRAA